MKFDQPLQEGQFLKRYKRFFADIALADETITAHVPNTGSLKSCAAPGLPCLVSHNSDPKRKLKYTLQMIKTATSWVGVNTGLSNALTWELWTSQLMPHWQKFSGACREIKINDKTRIDMVLWGSDVGPTKSGRIDLSHINAHSLHFVEVKNVTMAEGDAALFPDAVTTRGQKHIEELVQLIDAGHSAEILFTIQRTDCNVFRPADQIDPTYAKLLRMAHQKGLKITPIPCNIKKDEIRLAPENTLPVEL